MEPDEILIDQYLTDRLSASEMEAVQIRIAKDDDFALLVGKRKALLYAIDQVTDQELRATFDQIEQKMGIGTSSNEKANTDVKSGRTRSLPKNLIGIAAGIAILLGLFFWIGDSSDNLTNQYASQLIFDEDKLRSEIKDAAGFGLVEEADGEEKTQRALLLELVREQQFEQAIRSFPRHLELFPDDDVARFYYGTALMARKKYNEAIQLFEDCFNMEEEEYRIDAKWNAALMYLLEGECEIGVSLLNNLKGESIGRYRQKAENILLTKDC